MTTSGLLSPRQVQALQLLSLDSTDELLYGGAAGGGKTWLGCFWIWYLCRKYPRTRYVVARRHLKDIINSTLPSFFKVVTVAEGAGQADYKPERYWLYNSRKETITHARNGSQIVLVDTEYKPTDPLFDRYGGGEYTAGWCEEVQETSRKAYSALRTRIGRHLNAELGIHPIMLSTCNPAKSWIYTDFYRPWREGKLPPGRLFLPATIDDNPYLTEEYRAILQNIGDPAMRARLLSGSWEYEDDEGQLIPARLLVNALQAPATPGPVRLGIDVALGGPRADSTTIATVRGNALESIEQINASDYMGDPAGFDLWLTDLLAERIREAGALEPNAVRMDYSGIGANLWHLLRANHGLAVYPWKGQQPPIQRAGRPIKYANLRSQAWWELKEKCRLKAWKMPAIYDEELWQELTAVRYSTRADTIALEDKHYIRHRLGRSPDKADALVMALFELPAGQTGPAKVIVR